MNTRSKTNNLNNLNNINIDFDEASKVWRQNKKHIGQGHFKYICIKEIEKDGTNCGKACYKDSLYCWTHRGCNKKDN